MRTIVIMPGGFHPFHAGHAALYKSAVEAFNNADTYVAATNDTKTRPFPFAIKEKLAKLAGVADKHFVQVKSPFQAKEITQHYNPDEDVLIFVRSEKDKNEQPKPGGTKKDGSPAYFQPWTGKNLQSFSKHAYIAYLPTVEFGPGITSASEIRDAWPTLNDKRKTAMVMSLYPTTQKNPKLAANVVKMLDMGMGNDVAEAINKVEPISKSVPIQKTVIHPVKQHMHSPPEKKTTPAVVNHIKPREVKEFAPPGSDDGGGDSRSRRIRKLLEIAIQVAKEKNIDELGMIHGMNMIAGDDFFNTAVEGILSDITDKEYMFVLQSAYKTVKQGLAEAKKKRKKKSKNRSLGRYFFPGYSYYGGSGESGEGGGDGGGEGMEEGKITLSTDPNWYGATVDNYQASGPVVNIPANQLVGFEPDDKMNQPKSKVNVEKIVAGLKQGAKLPPLLVRKYKNGYQVLDGHHRFWAYKLLGVKSIPAQIVPDSDIEEISKQGVAEGQLNELDLFAPVTTFIKMTDGSYIQADWRKSQGNPGLSDSASFVNFKPVNPNVAKQLGLDSYQRNNSISNHRDGTIVPGGPIQGSGPLANRGYEVVDYNKPETMKELPPEIKSELIKWIQKQGVAEGLDDPWGDQGNFAGDKPVNIGGDTVKQLQVGDIVTYFGQKARIEAMSKTGNTSRITIANKMGGTTQDVLTRDLKRTGISEENGGVGGGFGTNYPGTYEQENGPFTHKGGLKLTSLTTESVDYLDEK